MRYIIAYTLSFLFVLSVMGLLLIGAYTARGDFGALFCLYVALVGGFGGPISLWIGKKEKN